MYTVSALWTTLISTTGHWFETKVNIAGTGYGQNKIISLSVNRRLFTGEQPSVGGCLSAEIDLTMLAPSSAVPRMAQITPYARVCAGSQQSEWIPQGVYFLDTREVTDNNDGLNILTLHGYDAMLKAEADYPNTTHDWPMSDIAVVNEIASTIGVSVDARTTALMTADYSIGLPAGYSMREVLSNIAGMYAGNWVMGLDGALLLVPINSYPDETRLLVTAAGEPITFGGDRILV